MNIETLGRQRLESRMKSRVTIHRLTGGETKNANGYTVPEWSTDPNVPFRLGSSRGAGGSRRVTVAGSEVEAGLRTGSVPIGTDLRDNDLLEITDGENVGVVVRVVDATPQDQATALRVPVIVVSRPEEW